jgi:acyl dehydratase
MIGRERTFTESDVDEWCERNGNPNPLHVDSHEALESSFGQRIVPAMMLLNQLPGMVSDIGGDDTEVILAGITAARFRDPVLLNETVKFTVFDLEEGENYSTVEFEARVEDRGSLAASGALTLVVR